MPARYSLLTLHKRFINVVFGDTDLVKAALFQKPVEFRLQVEGETWKQGDSVRGTLTIKNHGSESLSLKEYQVALAIGETRKLKKDPKSAFSPLSHQGFSAGQSLAAQGEAEIPFCFDTDLNSPVTDNARGLYVIYGNLESEIFGLLPLKFVPCEILEHVLQILEIQHRFVRKSQKSNKGLTEIKFVPPQSKAFATIESVTLITHWQSDTLSIDYEFAVKKIEALSASMELKKATRNVEREYSPAQYRLPSGRFHHEEMERAVQDALASVGNSLIP